MDRSQFLLMALITAVMSAAQLGCEGDSSGEYRTYSEAVAMQEFPTRSEVGKPTSVPFDESSQSAQLPDASNLPIEPELAAEPVSLSEARELEAQELIAVLSHAATGESSAIDTVDYSETLLRGDSPETSASLGIVRPDSADPPTGGSLTDLSEAPVEVRQIELLVPEKTFKAEGPENALRVSYDDVDLLKVLNMEPVPEDAVSHFPDWLSELNGKRIRIRGFMYPTYEATGLRYFVLARDNDICCFGRNPKIYDLIEVLMREGVTADYIQGRPFDVVGVFHIRPEVDEGELYQLFQIDDAVVNDR